MSKFCGSCGAPLKPSAEFCGSCGTKTQTDGGYDSTAEIRPAGPREKKKALPVIGLIFAVLLIAGGAYWFFPKDSPEIEIADYYPKAGSRGEYVLLALNMPVKDAELEIYYGTEGIQGTRIADNVIAVNVPLDARSSDLNVKYKGQEAKAPFTVLPEEWLELSREKAEPSQEIQSVRCAEDIIVTLPGNFLGEEKTILVSKVNNPAVLADSPFGLSTVYDISIEGMQQLPEYIQISMKYDPDWFDEGTSVADYLEPRRWDAENQVWVDLYYRVDENMQTVHFLTDHLSFFTLSITSVKFIGMAKAAVTVGVVAYGLEWLANDVYISRDQNIRILYSKKAVAGSFPDKDWEKVMSGGRLGHPSGYRHLAPFMVQDIGNILETSLKAYIDYGFADSKDDERGQRHRHGVGCHNDNAVQPGDPAAQNHDL